VFLYSSTPLLLYSSTLKALKAANYLTYSHRKNNKGFGLIEAVIALAVIAVLTTFGLPAYRDWVANAQIRDTTEELVALINLAKSETTNRKRSVALCGQGTTAEECQMDSKNWSQGANLATVKIIGGHNDTYQIQTGWNIPPTPTLPTPPASQTLKDAQGNPIASYDVTACYNYINCVNKNPANANQCYQDSIAKINDAIQKANDENKKYQHVSSDLFKQFQAKQADINEMQAWDAYFSGTKTNLIKQVDYLTETYNSKWKTAAGTTKASGTTVTGITITTVDPYYEENKKQLEDLIADYEKANPTVSCTAYTNSTGMKESSLDCSNQETHDYIASNINKSAPGLHFLYECDAVHQQKTGICRKILQAITTIPVPTQRKSNPYFSIENAIPNSSFEFDFLGKDYGTAAVMDAALKAYAEVINQPPCSNYFAKLGGKIGNSAVFTKAYAYTPIPKIKTPTHGYDLKCDVPQNNAVMNLCENFVAGNPPPVPTPIMETVVNQTDPEIKVEQILQRANAKKDITIDAHHSSLIFTNTGMLNIKVLDEIKYGNTKALDIDISPVFVVSHARFDNDSAKQSRKICINRIGVVKVVPGDKDCDY